MCGICGIIGYPSSEPQEAIVRRTLASIFHRGPDEEGLLLAPPVAAGIRRLSIIDLPGGSQPVWNETQTLAVVFNGEIYNFRELRRELESVGHRFRTRSDTEVIVHAYESWGESCAERLHGMFAFAVVEVPQGRGGPASRLFLARDRLGIKPLYYAAAGGAFLFASEVRALLAAGLLPGRVSPSALQAYLLFGSVGEPETLIEGIVSLPPGHSLSIACNETLALPPPKAFWTPARCDDFDAKGDGVSKSAPASTAARVRSLLESAVERHLLADVPVGIFLSSGLDSTAIAALACARQSGIHTFTVAFPEEGFNEAGLARRTAQRLGSCHSELALSHDEMLARLGEAVSAFDQPSMDGINTYFVSWAARQAGLKVALSGLGSDELFGGYTSFRATAPLARLARAARLVPKPVRSVAASALEKSQAYPTSRAKFRKAAAAWLDPGTLPHPYFFSRTLFPPQDVARVFDSAGWQAARWWQSLRRAADEASGMDSFTAISWLELRSYLPNTLLRDTDAMSMRHSLEVRVPFLDGTLVDSLLSLPQSAKFDPARPKSLLIAALGELLPPDIVAQRKRTFTFPWENWLRGALGKRVAEGIRDWSPALSPFLPADFALAVWRDFLRGDTTWSRPWSLYVLNEWVKRNCRHAGSAASLGAAATSAG